MNLEHLRKKPFYLNDAKMAWVESQLESMTEDDKISQLFCLISYGSDEGYLENLIKTYKPGGVMCRPMPLEEVVESIRIMQKNSEIPLLISANLEKGGNGLISEGTSLGSQMQVAATDDVEMAAKLG